MSKNDANLQNPIGVMDSGVGGLSVLQHIHALLPFESLVYFADSQHAPYGTKSPEQIRQRVYAVSKFLLTQGVKALVIACNTATAAAAQSLREKYAFLDIPIIAMEPAVKPAVAASKNGIIGVLATTGTLKSAQFAALLESYGRDVNIITQACPGLVECIEKGDLRSEHTRNLVKSYCQPLIDQNVDTIVLGCTHYPFLKSMIQDIAGHHIRLIETGAAVANQLKRRLEQKELLSPSFQTGDITLWTNSTSSDAGLIIEQLWGGPCKVRHWR